MLERLQKIIARAGIASRRHAEELIRSGQVSVNGVVVTELGAKADPERDRVEAAGRVAERPAEPGYYLLHKPSHVVATMSDPEGRATLRHVLRGLSGGVFPVGRLDYAASGAILLTTDGQLADRILKNSARMPKVYWLKVAGRLTDDEMQQIARRSHARLRRLRAPGAAASHPSNPWYEAELTDARSDVLRRELFAIDHPVEKLKRVRFGPLELGNLPEGHYRQLAPSEVAQLRRVVEQASGAAPAPGQTKDAASAPMPKSYASSAWRAKRAAPAWQKKSVANPEQAKPVELGAPPKRTAPPPQTPWQTPREAPPQNPLQAKTGAPAGQRPWQKKPAASASHTKGSAPVRPAKRTPPAWQSPAQKKSGAKAWQKKSGAPEWQKKSGAPPWRKKSGANAGHAENAARKPYGRGTGSHGGRNRHDRDARHGHGKNPRHPAQ